jgi:Ser/Thr protein kinase RdoA (MazF antagonist)
MLPDLDGIYGMTCSTAEWQKRLARLLPALPGLLLRNVRDATWTWVATCRNSNRSLQPGIIIHNGQ